jgi:hypothetical protein
MCNTVGAGDEEREKCKEGRDDRQLPDFQILVERLDTYPKKRDDL